jgi:hypothetical protein
MAKATHRVAFGVPGANKQEEEIAMATLRLT